MESQGKYQGEIRRIDVGGRVLPWIWDEVTKHWTEIDLAQLQHYNNSLSQEYHNNDQINEVDDMEEPEDELLAPIRYSGDAYFKSGMYDSAVIIDKN